MTMVTDPMKKITPFCVYVMPFMEEGARFERYDFKLHWYQQNSIVSQPLSIYQCPSDVKTFYQEPVILDWFGNYGINWGSHTFGDQAFQPPDMPLAPQVKDARAAPFYESWGARIRQLSDGTSKTMALVEVRQGPQSTGASDLDRRGRIWNPASGTYQVSAFYPPNAADADSTRCQNRPDLRLPCVNRNAPLHELHLLSARSNHPGGVQVVMFDSSVRFVTNGVDLDAWRAAATRKDGLPGSL
jgi:hypothetical protein